MSAGELTHEAWLLGMARDLCNAATKRSQGRWAKRSFRAWLHEGQLWLSCRAEPSGYCVGLVRIDSVEHERWDADQVREHLGDFFSQPDCLRSKLPIDTAPIASDWSRRYPLLWAFLTDTLDNADRRRKTGTIAACVDQGAVKLWLNDRHTGYMLWGTCDTFADVFETAEGMLSDPDPQWRKNRYVHGDSGRVDPKSS